MQKFSREFGVSHLIGQRWICSFDLVSSQGNTITNKFYAISKAELLQEGIFFPHPFIYYYISFKS
jgi:hypothetical protein